MKRISLVLVLVGAFLLFPYLLMASEDINIKMDGYILESDTAPAIVNDRVLIPFRLISEAMNVQVEWNNESRTIKAVSGDTDLFLTIASKTAHINGQPTQLDVAPEIINNRTMVPLRFFSSVFGCEVDWNSSSRTVSIKTPPAKMKVIGYYALGDSKTSSWTNLFGKAYPESAKGHTDIVTDLALGWYSLDENGQVLTKSRTGWQRPVGWETVLDAAKHYNMEQEMVIHMTNKDRLITSLISNPKSVDRAIKEISAEARKYSGVNLDMEGLGLSEEGSDLIRVRNNFSSFVGLLAKELHKNGKVLSLSLHPPNSSYRGYDYAALGKYADEIIIMAYDYGPKPEPDYKVDEAIMLALRDVPAHKLILGISTPSESAASLGTKIGLAKRYKLKGIAIWRLGLVTDDMWGVLESILEK